MVRIRGETNEKRSLDKDDAYRESMATSTPRSNGDSLGRKKGLFIPWFKSKVGKETRRNADGMMYEF